LPQPIKLSPTRPMEERLPPNAVMVSQNESMPHQTPVQA
jgi:hypothetical protein